MAGFKCDRLLPPVVASKAGAFYYTQQRQIMVAPYTVQNGAFVAGTPHVWSERRLGSLHTNRLFDLHPDGERVLELVAREEGPRIPESQVTFVFNFLDELRRRVPLPD